MSQTDVLIGHRLALYGEVLTAAFRAKQPDLVVHAVAPADLDEMVRALRPRVVICSAVTTTVLDCSTAWISLYPGESDEAIVSIAGLLRTIRNATIGQLLSIISDVLSLQLHQPINPDAQITRLSDGTPVGLA